MNYIRCGKGKDLVFLHGYLSSKESFYPQIEYFSRYYRVTAPDFPGFGEGGELTQPYSVGDYADWLLNWLREVGVEDFKVNGDFSLQQIPHVPFTFYFSH